MMGERTRRSTAVAVPTMASERRERERQLTIKEEKKKKRVPRRKYLRPDNNSHTTPRESPRGAHIHATPQQRSMQMQRREGVESVESKEAGRGRRKLKQLLVKIAKYPTH